MRQMAAKENCMLFGKTSVTLFTLSGVDAVLNGAGVLRASTITITTCMPWVWASGDEIRI